MKYEKPTVVDYGSIANHTFLGAIGGTPPKDTRMCTKDNHGDESCPAAGPTP
jgi:hypothetical protein